MRKPVWFRFLIVLCLSVSIFSGLAAAEIPPTPPQNPPAPSQAPPTSPDSQTPAAPQQPAVPPVNITGQNDGNEVVPLGDGKGLNTVISMLSGGTRAVLARWAADTNGDGLVDRHDFPVLSVFDVPSRRIVPLFTAADRTLSVAWVDADRLLVLRSKPKQAPTDERGDLLLRVLSTGKETLIAADVVWFAVCPVSLQTLLWQVSSDTNGDSVLDRQDIPAVSLADLRPAQPVPVRLISGVPMLASEFNGDGKSFTYLARREDTNRDGRLTDDDAWRAYCYDLTAWESRPLAPAIKGSIVVARPAPQGGTTALVERDVSPDGSGREDALYFRKPEGALTSVGVLGQGREIVRVQWSPDGERCAVTYRQPAELGLPLTGVLIYSQEGQLVRAYEPPSLSGVSYPSLLWATNGHAYLIERREGEAEDARPNGTSLFLAALGDEEAVTVFEPGETAVPAVWTNSGVIYTQYPGESTNAPLGLFARYRFSGSLSLYEPLTFTTGGLKMTIRPAAITARGLYLRVVMGNESGQEAAFDPARLTLLPAGGEAVPRLNEDDLAGDLPARVIVDTLMQAYTLSSGATYGGFMAFALPPAGNGTSSLVVTDSKGTRLAEVKVECQVSLEYY